MQEAQNEYRARSDLYWQEAQVALRQENPLQASEKLWGAAAQTVKAVAEARGWPHTTHRDLYNVINRLMAETGQGRLGELFAIANALHQNFYEGWMSFQQVRYHAANIQELRELLFPLI